MKTIRHYLSYLSRLIVMSIGSVMIYRFDFSVRMVRAVAEVVVGVITINALFGNVPEVVGWTRDGVLLVYTLALAVAAVVMFFFGSGLEGFYRKIQEGTLDYDLVKPMDTQWLASVRVIYVTNLFRIFSAVGAFIFVLARSDIQVNGLQWLLFVTTLLAALILYYSIMFLASMVSFWSVTPEMFYLFSSLTSVMRYPTALFSPTIRLVLTLIPIMLISTVPVQVLLGTAGFVSFVSLPIAGVFLLINRWVWKAGLRSYQSVSS